MDSPDHPNPFTAEQATRATLGGHAPQDTERAVGVLTALIRRLDAAPRADSLRALVRDATVAIEECLDDRRGREPRAEPRSPATELGGLVRQLAIADPSESVDIMKQIRRVLGRMDAATGDTEDEARARRRPRAELEEDVRFASGMR